MIKIIKFLSLLFCTTLLIACNKSNNEVDVTPIVDKVYKVSDIKILYMGGVGNIYLSQGDSEKMLIKANEDLFDKIFVANSDHKLIFDTQDGISLGNNEKIDVYITIKKISEIDLSGVGNFETTNQLITDSLIINSTGVGNLDLDVACTLLKVSLKGTGNSNFTGKASMVYFDKSGVGNLNSSLLYAEILHINNSGVGNADVYASKEIYITSSGIGNLIYRGDAVVKELNISGIGTVSKQ